MKFNIYSKIAYLTFTLFLTLAIGCKKEDQSANSAGNGNGNGNGSASTIYICGITEGSSGMAKC